MNNEKVKIIKEILKNCADEKKPCSDCKYFGKCEKLLGKGEVLTLINEFERENERLLEQRNKTYNIWVKDTEQLKNRIAELEKHIERVESERRRIKQDRDKKDELASKFIDSYNDSLKQFAERLKEKAIKQRWQGLGTTDIEETLKEFINGKV